MNNQDSVARDHQPETPIKLVALDLDDTTLDSRFSISERTRIAIRRAIERGVHVLIATGRMVRSAAPFASDLGTGDPLIAYNGALVVLPDSTVVEHFPLTLDQTISLALWAQAHNATLNLYLDDKLFVSSLNRNTAYYTRIARVEAIPVGDLAAYMESAGKGATKALIVGPEPDIAAWYPELQGLFGGSMNVTGSKPRYIEIMDESVNKGRALRACARRLNIPPEQVMAVGNAPNDLEMIEYAGTGVAVANSHPILLQRADAVVASNDEDGVAEALERFVLHTWEKLPGSSRQDCI